MDSDYYLSGLYGQFAFWDSAVTPIVALSFAFLFLIISAFMAASEVAYFSLSSDELNEVQDKKKYADLLVARLLDRPDYLLASILIFRKTLNVTVVILSAFAFYCLFDFSYTPVLGILVLILVLTFLILLSQMMPKRYARIYPLSFARFLSPLMNLINFLCFPFSKLFLLSSSYVKRRISKRDPEKAVNELSKPFDPTAPRNSMPDEKEMIKEVMKFYDKTADEIMTSRLDIEDIDIKSSFSYVRDFVFESGYSRIPVYEESEDNMKGILYLRDLLPHFDKGDEFEWQALIRPAYFVPETKKIDGLLEDFRTNKIHMAIVVDEFGGTSGIVTMEDILEEIVGEIFDEYDEDEQQSIPLADGSFILKAKILLTNFFRVTDVDPEEFDELTEEVETLGGLVLEIKGGFPKSQEVVEYKNYRFQILEIDNRRIIKVKFSIIGEETKPKES